MVAYDAKSKQALSSGGLTRARSNDSNWTVLGIGPFNSGTLREEYALAKKLEAPHQRLLLSNLPSPESRPQYVTYPTPPTYNILDPQNYRAGGEERRKFAAEIGCDPETTNPALVALLDNLAIRRGLGKTGSNVGLHVVLPGLGLLATTQDFKEQLVKQSPAEINGAIERELLAMGVWEPVARQFCRERSYTTLQRMIFMDHLRSIKQVENAQFLVLRATTAYNEAEGLGVIREMQLLRNLHQRHGILRIDLQGLPVAMLQNNNVVIVNAADYVHDTQELRDAIAAFRRARPNDPAIFVTAGTVSARAQKTLADFDVQVIESGNTTLVERISRQPVRR